jgi:hypothetical protein
MTKFSLLVLDDNNRVTQVIEYESQEQCENAYDVFKFFGITTLRVATAPEFPHTLHPLFFYPGAFIRID